MSLLRRVLGISTFLAALCLPVSAISGSAYDDGVDAYRSKNYQLARELWAKAIDSGEISALNNLGYLLYFGLGGERDQARAIGLWKQAASQGHSESQWHLGKAHEDGTAVNKSLIEAYAWYRCSIASAEAPLEGEEKSEAEIAKDAHQSLNKLLERLAPSDFGAAEALAQQYIKLYSRKKS